MMVPTRSRIETLAADIDLAHQDYLHNGGEAGWAVSTVFAGVVLHYLNLIKPNDACDLGSGFTSYVLRWWAEVNPCKVTSVDTDQAWLATTASFLLSHQLDPFNLYTYDEWQTRTDTYDLIVHDLAQGDLRETAMWVAARRLNQGGVIVFDDAQHGPHQDAMQAVCDEFGFRFHVINDARDGHGRYCAVGIA